METVLSIYALQRVPATVAIATMENIPECSASFDPGRLENFFYSLAIKETGSRKNRSTFAGVSDRNDHRAIEGIIRKPAS